MASKIDIINAAFVLLGHRSVNNLGDNSGEDVKKASAIYDLYYDSFLTYYDWRFALKKVQMSQIANPTEVTGYNYAYQIPPDFLRIYKISPASQYEIYGTYIYTNIDSPVDIYYTYRVPEGILPAYYIEFLIEKFAELFAMPITQQPELVQIWGASAEDKLNRATAIESQSQTSLTFADKPLAQAKYWYNAGS